MSKHTPVNSAGVTNLFNRYFEYQRIVSVVTVTSEGQFIQNNVPDDYGGLEMDVEVVHAVRMVNSKSEMLLFEFYNEPPMDKDRKKGGPVQRDGVEVVPGAGPSTVPVVQVGKINPTLTPEQVRAGEFALAAFEKARGDTPRAPQY